MRIRTILTTAAVSAALVAGGVAGPASAAVAPVTVQPVITVPTLAITVPAFTAALPLTINASTPANTRVNYWLVTNGVPESQLSFGYTDAAGNVTADLNANRFSSTALVPGTYQVYFTTDATTAYFTDPTPDVNYLAAQSPVISLTVTKLTTKISGFSTKTKVIKYKKYLSKKFDYFTVKNAGPDNKVVLQYKKPGSKKWKNVATTSTYTFDGSYLSIKDGYKYNQGLTSKYFPKGTQYFRIWVKATPYVTGVYSKSFKFKVK